VLPRPCPGSSPPTSLTAALPSSALFRIYAAGWHRRLKRADYTQHGPEEKRRQDTTDCLGQDVTRHSVPREVPPNGEGKGNRRVCAHELDDHRYHAATRNRQHAWSYGPAASSGDDFAIGSNHDQQKRAQASAKIRPQERDSGSQLTTAAARRHSGAPELHRPRTGLAVTVQGHITICGRLSWHHTTPHYTQPQRWGNGRNLR
jgi:hypothetical protein